jgi:hypothetical protein
MSRKKVEPAPVAPEEKPWSLTQADIEATTDLEFVWGTTRCLPPWEIIPEEFREYYGSRKANIYIKMADSFFCGDPLPPGNVAFNEGFSLSPNLMRFIMAHMKSFDPKHEHKIAGVAYMISIITTVTPDKELQ